IDSKLISTGLPVAHRLFLIRFWVTSGGLVVHPSLGQCSSIARLTPPLNGRLQFTTNALSTLSVHLFAAWFEGVGSLQRSTFCACWWPFEPARLGLVDL